MQLSLSTLKSQWNYLSHIWPTNKQQWESKESDFLRLLQNLSLQLGSFDDIRPISMITLRSRINELYVATFTMDETAPNWNQDQYGGRKGSSTDHVLISLWDQIQTGLDAGISQLPLVTNIIFNIYLSYECANCCFIYFICILCAYYYTILLY